MKGMLTIKYYGQVSCGNEVSPLDNYGNPGAIDATFASTPSFT